MLDFKKYTSFDLKILNKKILFKGKYDNESLQANLTKGQSTLHFLEKFDISVQIDIFKLKQNKLNANNWTPLKINIKLNLLKLHIDDLKLTYIFKTLENIQKMFQGHSEVETDLGSQYNNEQIGTMKCSLF